MGMQCVEDLKIGLKLRSVAFFVFRIGVLCMSEISGRMPYDLFYSLFVRDLLAKTSRFAYRLYRTLKKIICICDRNLRTCFS